MVTAASPFSNLGQLPRNFGGFSSFTQPSSQQFPAFGTSGSQAPSIFDDFLEEEPDIPFFGRLFEQGPQGRSRFTPNQQSAFRNQRQQFTNRFLGLINEQLQRGEVPSLRQADFFGNLDFGREFNQQVGPDTARFAPRTRFLGR